MRFPNWIVTILILFSAIGSSTMADAAIVFSGTGRWDASTEATEVSTPNGYFGFSFEIAEPLGQFGPAYASQFQNGYYDSAGASIYSDGFWELNFLPPGPSVLPGVVPAGGPIGGVNFRPNTFGAYNVYMPDFWPFSSPGILAAPAIFVVDFVLFDNFDYPSSLPVHGHGSGYVSILRVPDPAISIPEPQPWAMMIVGIAMIGGAMRLRRRGCIALA